jgi:hypothetical protein
MPGHLGMFGAGLDGSDDLIGDGFVDVKAFG